MPAYHWTSWQFHYLNLLWMRESGWNRFAYNHSSGAYGIPQAVPGDKMAAAGPDWRTSARTQIIWGMGYIQVTLRKSVECVAARVAVWLVLTRSAQNRDIRDSAIPTGRRSTRAANGSSLRQNPAKACQPFGDARPVWNAPGCRVNAVSRRRPASISGTSACPTAAG